MISITNQTRQLFNSASSRIRRRAIQMVPVLISTAKARRTISYGSVSSGIDYTSPRISKHLGLIAGLLQSLKDDDKEDIPALTVVCVYKRTNRPADGIYHWHIIDEPWEVALKRVYNYKKWDDVKAALLSIEG